MDNDSGQNNSEGPLRDYPFKGDKRFGQEGKSPEQSEPSLEIATSSEEEKIFHLEFHCEGDKLRVQQFEGSVGDQKTLRHYEDATVSFNKAKAYSKRIKKLLSSTNRTGKICKENLVNLKQAGQLLYNELFPSGIKDSLNRTNLKTLIISIDDRLVDIPWELAYDGQEFLCIRFNMGRVVSTRQQTMAAQREIVAPLKMLIVTDPQGNLPASYEEGIRLRNMLDEKGGGINVDLKSSEVNTDYVKGKLRLYDIFHYAGHAEYKEQNPAESGFLLKDGKLTANAITEMIDRMPFPSFVFSNACQSGQTEEWKVMKGYENIFGLANAFLLSGVRHYLGTFWEIQDDSGLYFSLCFYEEMLNGIMIGEAVRKARMEFIEKYGEDRIIWASYVLYGVPYTRYISKSPFSRKNKPSARQLNKIPADTIRTSEETREVFAFPKQKRNLQMIIISIMVLFLAIIFLSKLKKNRTAPAPKLEVNVIGSSREKRFENTIELIDKLDENIKKDGIPKVKRFDEWTSIPIVLGFLDIEGIGISDMERDYIHGRLTKFLQNTSRVTIVEREILDKLLSEHMLSHSDLADPATALRIGKMLSAGLISTGSIARDKDTWIINLRFIDTETTAVKIAISTGIETRDLDIVSEEIAACIFNDFKKKYPLQGKIISVDEEGIFVNLGFDVGLNKGAIMEVLSADNRIVDKIEAIEVMETKSRAKAFSGEDEITEGLRVKEIVNIKLFSEQVD